MEGTPSSAPLRALDERERLVLAMTPTPLQAAPALARELGMRPDRLLLKMDAWTGFGLGGNKVRKLEYELAPGRLAGVTCLVTAGGPQSNHCRVTAAAAAYLGLRSILVIGGPEPGEPEGNALLHRLLGAEIRPAPDRDARAPMMEEAAREVEAEGGKALVVPLGASTPLGALGYVRAAREFLVQLARLEAPERPTRVILSTSSGGTLAGLFLGFRLTGADHVRLLGVSADVAPDHSLAGVRSIARGAARLLGVQDGDLPERATVEQSVQVTDRFVGSGYAIPTTEGDAALDLFARKAGVILDPVYTAKAAAGLISLVRGERLDALHPLDPEERTVFWHTGGHPALLDPHTRRPAPSSREASPPPL